MDHEYIPEEAEVMPHSLEAEQAVLGAVFIDSDALIGAMEKLSPDDFYRKPHQLIFDAMITVDEYGEPVDLVTVTACLQSKQQLEEVGGVSYLTSLANAVPTAANVGYYANIVKEKFSERFASIAIRNALTQAQKGNYQEVISSIQETALTLSDQAAEKTEFKKIEEVLPNVFEQIEKNYLFKDKGVTGVASGFTDLDKMTAGFQNSDLIIVAARPSVGKTAFALNIAQNAAINMTSPVVIFSLEMSAEQLVQRMVCAEMNIDAGRLRTGWLEGDDWERITMGMGNLSQRNIMIDDSPTLTVQDIRAKCRRLKKSQGLGLVIIDYLQLIRGRSGKANRQEEVADISRTLKALAREIDTPIIALSQLSRGVEQRQDKRPLMSDLRESGSIEQDADIVAFLYREDYYVSDTDKKNIIEIIIAKQRNGPTGTVELVFLKNYNKFVNYDRGYHEPKQTRNQPDMAARYG